MKPIKNSMCNIKSVMYFIPICVFLSGNLAAQDLMTHNFDDGDFGPFEVVSSSMLDRFDFYNTRLYTNWTTDDYDGSNYSKKSEFRAADNAYTYQNEFWTGFSLWVRSDYMKDPDTGESLDTDAGIMQIWGFDDDEDTANHYAMLKFDGRDGGGLTWYHRYGAGSTGRADYMVYEDFPRNTWVDIIVHIDLSSDGGTVQIWADGDLLLNVSDQTLGWGEMDSSGQTGNSYSTPGSWGGYNYRSDSGCDTTWDSSSHCFDGYTDGEARTLGFDDLTLWNGSDGYDIVDPGNSSSSSSSSGNTTVHMTKRNASSYAIDGNHGGSNGQNVYLWTANTSNENQQWIEISQGNDYYSYQKYDTDYCLDGGNGGSRRQSVYLWSCDDDNYNQHWLKVSTGDDSYRLEKRNSSDYSIDGNNGGSNGQELYLWDSSDSNENQQWYFEEL